MEENEKKKSKIRGIERFMRSLSVIKASVGEERDRGPALEQVNEVEKVSRDIRTRYRGHWKAQSSVRNDSGEVSG